MKSTTVMVKTNDFSESWSLVVYAAMHYGITIPADETPNAPLCKDISLITELSGNAIQQIKDRQFHPLYPQQKGVDAYVKQFNPTISECVNILDPYTGFDYTYYERLFLHHLQMYKIIDNFHPYNRRLQGTTWIPEKDLFSYESVPCLQRISMRNYGDGTCEITFTWRSRDLYKAYQMNLVGLINAILPQIEKKYGIECVKITDRVDYAHVYEDDWEIAKQIPVNMRDVHNKIML